MAGYEVIMTIPDYISKIEQLEKEKQELIEYLKKKKEEYIKLYNLSYDIIAFNEYESLINLCGEILSKIEKR